VGSWFVASLNYFGLGKALWDFFNLFKVGLFPAFFENYILPYFSPFSQPTLGGTQGIVFNWKGGAFLGFPT